MKIPTLIKFDNYKNYTGKKIQVDITCYEAGIIYPDNNILVGMNEDYYYFVSDKDTPDEQYWHWEAKEQPKEFGKINMQIQV